MDTKAYYMNLPVDLSGSRSKNRFRLELLWGLGKLIDLMETDEDFTVIFDYVCDIEVHLSEKLEFYQIKTHNSVKGSHYQIRQLVKKKNSNSEGSILGKLYTLKIKDEDENVTVAVVSNIPLSEGLKQYDSLCLSFADISISGKEHLIQALRKELSISDINLENVFFIRSHMNFKEPMNELSGKLNFTFEKLMGREPARPNTLYRLIESIINDKACYEFKSGKYELLIKNKGVTRSEFKGILKHSAVSEETGIKNTQEYINNLKDLREKKIYHKALSKLITIIQKSRPLKELEKIIAKKVHEIEPYDIETAIEQLTTVFHNEFPPEISDVEKKVLYILVTNRYVEGGYEDELGI